jgi:hypothetical protein
VRFTRTILCCLDSGLFETETSYTLIDDPLERVDNRRIIYLRTCLRTYSAEVYLIIELDTAMEIESELIGLDP